MASQPTKRKRNEITAFEKREIARYKEEHPKASLDFLSKHFGEVFGHSVLLLDNAASHKCASMSLQNVTMHFLPPNTTSHIQPRDAGIIRTFKAYYKRSLVRHYITCAEEGRDQTLTLRQALLFVKTSWTEVSAQTIKNCYRHVDIISQDGDSFVDEDDIALLELRLILNEYPSDDVVSTEEYVAEEESETTCEPLTDSEIINMVQPTEDGQEEEEDSEESEQAPVPPTSTEASKYLDSLVTYFETIGDEVALGKIIDVKNSMKKGYHIVDQFKPVSIDANVGTTAPEMDPARLE
ncbi:jerky protein homolog-like [Haliotis asinina]|uniref:jerky protein homolog-like n=1 Tax=Haliotis asinina TaxID=109174 RepID=UPI003531FF24